MSEDFSIVVKRFEPKDPRLGRHVVHDSRSLRYLAPRRDPATLTSRSHSIAVPIMDQGSVGSCTGHAGTALLGGTAYWLAGRDAIGPGDPHVFAENLYGDATLIDPWTGSWRPDDTGSDGLSIAKVLKARGLISGYQHATSLEAVLTALAQRPVIVGTSWYEGMYDTSWEGEINVAGQTLGGHEYCLDEIDVERQRVWMRNSWGGGYGLLGRAWMSWDALRRLLADYGDCTVMIPRSEPPPVPTPQPIPTPAPVPPPVPTPAPPQPNDPGPSAEDLVLHDALQRFLKTKAPSAYLRHAAAEWLKTKE